MFVFNLFSEIPQLSELRPDGLARSTAGGPTRPGIVHRLDRHTSGVIVVAKTNEAHMNLRFTTPDENKVWQAYPVRGQRCVIGRPD